MPRHRRSVWTVPAPIPSRFEFVERQLERTLERIVRQHLVRSAQEYAAANNGHASRLRLARADGGAATT
jgi:hypothetical protein